MPPRFAARSAPVLDRVVNREFDFNTGASTTATICFSTFGIDPATQFDVGIDNVRLRVQVPEPGSVALIGLAVTGLVALRRGRKK